MQENWEEAIAFVLKMEGGYTLDPNDLGGETNFGISHRAYPSVDIKNLTVELAKDIYRFDYWNACHCDELPRAFAIAVFDTAVNQGPGKARRLLQMALDLEVDGNIGTKTVSAAFRADNHQVKKFITLRLAEYARIMVTNPTQLVFANNWFSRVISLADLILWKPAAA